MALTGGIATGKSHVRLLFEKLGVPTIDADTLARAAVAPETAGLARVVERFGPGILDPSGAVDRRKLGDIVFEDAAARRDLEGIIHPYVRAATERWFTGLDAQRHPFAVADIPLLYEAGRERDFDAVIVVAVAPDRQLRRIMERDRLPEAEARRRIGAQWPIAAKVEKADFVIRTDGSFEHTAEQVRQVFDQLSVASGTR